MIAEISSGTVYKMMELQNKGRI